MQLVPPLSSAPARLYASRPLVSPVAHWEEVVSRQSSVQWVALGELRKEPGPEWVGCRQPAALELVEQMDVEEEKVVGSFVAVAAAAAAKARLLHRHLC